MVRLKSIFSLAVFLFFFSAELAQSCILQGCARHRAILHSERS